MKKIIFHIDQLLYRCLQRLRGYTLKTTVFRTIPPNFGSNVSSRLTRVDPLRRPACPHPNLTLAGVQHAGRPRVKGHARKPADSLLRLSELRRVLLGGTCRSAVGPEPRAVGTRDAFLHGGLARLQDAPPAFSDARRFCARVPVTTRGYEDHYAAARGGRLDVFGLVAREENGAAPASLGAREMGEELNAVTAFL